MENSNEAYEHNLKLYNESVRKDLDITLTSTIPTQKNLMKTILWLNSSVIGLCLAAVSKDFAIIYISMPFVFSYLAIITILYSLKDGRIKTLGTPSIKSIENITPNEYEKINGFITLNESYKKALDSNVELIQKRAIKIAFATNMTILSIISIFIITVLHINLMKGG
ncbi:hypothetical protein ACOTWK_05885 [Aliarcobacter butzleri]|uniref:hypothetical protein n=1 Tax=Aliarcobacter butzleri TaxID=28197 RepID=UPI00125F4309|nr:hypothetical protein [Aliarcobacter butzleri]MCG3651947.1 hypothetical protein [Aliarcobacter butzleri]